MNLIINKSILKKADTKFLFGLGIIFCVLIAFFKESIFPEKYFNDSHTIQKLIEHPYNDVGDYAFTNTATFYRVLHIDKHVLAPLIAIGFYLLVIIKLFKKYNVNQISITKFFLVVLYSMIAMVYMSTYSKDLIVFLFVIVPFVFFEKKNLLIWTAFVIFYAYFFRSYWFITILLFWGIKLFIINKPKLLLFTIPIFYIAISFVYHYVFGTSLTMIRYAVNIDRDADMAQTAINNFVEGTGFASEAANFFITLIFLIIPIPLLLLAKPFYIIIALLITTFFYNFIKLYINENNNKEFYNIFSFVISFILVQSLFEPDYGSFVRHLSPLYPLIFVCLARNTRLKLRNTPPQYHEES